MTVEFDFAVNGDRGGWCHICNTPFHKYTLDLTKEIDVSWGNNQTTNIYICEDCLEIMYQYFHRERNKQ